MRRSVAVGLLAATFVAACSGGGDDDATPTTQAGDGLRLPASEDDLSDTVLAGLAGGEIAFADYAGRPIVVNFFASTCAPCVREMPAIEAVKQDVGAEVAFVGVATNDRVDAARRRADETGVTWDLANDPQGAFITAVGGVVLPTTLFVDADGAVLEVHGGQISGDELREELEERFGIES